MSELTENDNGGRWVRVVASFKRQQEINF